MGYLPDLKDEIKKLRKLKGLTQKQLAKIVGVNQSLISQIENGLKTPSYKLADKILTALNESNFIVKDLATHKLIYVSPEDTINKVIKLMSDKYDQIPVIKNGLNVGNVSSRDIVRLMGKTDFKNLKVKDIMGLPLPVLKEDECMEKVRKVLLIFDAALIKIKNEYGIITRSDLIKNCNQT